jgi:hypothetical protein
MAIEEINITKVKQNLFKIPKARLAEINDFIEFILMKTESSRLKRVEKLEGIWQGMGFERVPDIDKSIREIRSESEKSILDNQGFRSS